jgi:hypothetical protein
MSQESRGKVLFFFKRSNLTYFLDLIDIVVDEGSPRHLSILPLTCRSKDEDNGLTEEKSDPKPITLIASLEKSSTPELELSKNSSSQTLFVPPKPIVIKRPSGRHDFF